MGPRRSHRWLAESVHDPARTGVRDYRSEGMAVRRNRDATALLLRFQEGEEERRQGRNELDAGDFADLSPGRSAEVRQPGWDGKPGRERATARQGDAGRGQRTGAGAVLAEFAGIFGDGRA